MSQHPVRSLAAVAAAALTVATLAGCSVIASATAQHTQVIYPSLATASPAAQASLPDFIPEDATEVIVRTLPGHGQTLTFASSTSLDPTLCRAGALTGKPRINSNWWPTSAPPADGTVCDSGWQLFQIDGTTYGWTAK